MLLKLILPISFIATTKFEIPCVTCILFLLDTAVLEKNTPW